MIAVAASRDTCACFDPRAGAVFSQEVVSIDNEGDVALLRCELCRATWLRLSMEVEGISESSRWYRGMLRGNAVAPTCAAEAKRHLATLPSYFAGGSYYGGEVREFAGPPY